MRNARIAFLLAAATGLWIGCSSSASTAPPPPTLEGAWQVTINSLDTGTVSPSSFIVKVWASADSYIVSMPIITWSAGPTVFNGEGSIVKFISDTLSGFSEGVFYLPCHDFQVWGRVNATRDTLLNAVVVITHDTTSKFGGIVCVGPRGKATAVKIGAAGSPPSAAPLTASGVWHVAVNGMVSGSIAPDTFSATFGSGSGSLSATFPALSWNGSALPADTFASAWVNADTLEFWRLRHGVADDRSCRFIAFFGQMNSRPDTMTGSVYAVDSNSAGCHVVSYGSFTARK